MKKLGVVALCAILIVAILVLVFYPVVMNKENNEIENNTVEEQQELDREYTVEEWEKMAFDFYEKKTGYRPSFIQTQDQGDGKLLIHLYDNVELHSTTRDYYTIDTKTGIATDLVGNQIDLVNGAYLEE